VAASRTFWPQALFNFRSLTIEFNRTCIKHCSTTEFVFQKWGGTKKHGASSFSPYKLPFQLVNPPNKMDTPRSKCLRLSMAMTWPRWVQMWYTKSEKKRTNMVQWRAKTKIYQISCIQSSLWPSSGDRFFACCEYLSRWALPAQKNLWSKIDLIFPSHIYT